MPPDDGRVTATAGISVPSAAPRSGTWSDYLRPLRFDHWIKNLVVPVGSVLALVAARVPPDWEAVWAAGLAALISGFVSSANYAINEVLDAPFDARHPVKRSRPIPSGRVRVVPLLALTALVTVGSLAAAHWLFAPAVLLAILALFVAALLYNLPPIRLKDWPYLDALVESVTNPIRLAIGWYAVSPAAGPPPILLLAAVWAFGAFLMTGKRLAELRLLGRTATDYRRTFRVYTIRRLLTAQLAYGTGTLVALVWLFTTERPRLLLTLPLVVAVLGWTLKMTFEPESPVIDPERLYRRPLFLLLMLAAFAIVVGVALA